MVVAGVADSSAYLDDFAAVRLKGADVIPNAFSFTPLGAQDISTSVTSAPLTLSGIEGATLVLFSGAGDYRINGGEYTRQPSMVGPGDQITVRQTTSSQFATTQTSYLTIGGVNGEFSTTTRAQAESGGGGAVGLEGLALFGVPLLAWARRRMNSKAK